MNILGTGLSGLVGSRIIELLKGRYTFQNLSLDTGVDITKPDILCPYFQNSKASWVFHFAAKTDVDACEKERNLGQQSQTWLINVRATQYLVSECKKTDKKLLYISSDFVFDGKSADYSEEDTPNPQSWYALTKYEGEKEVYTLGAQGLIIRISYPYRAVSPAKPDFVALIKQKLQKGDKITAPIDQQFIPTFIDDIAHAIDLLVNKGASGIYHVVGSQVLSPYEAAQKIAKIFGLDTSLISPTTFIEYYRGRAPRPFHAILKNDKISKFGVKLSTFDEGLAMIKS